MVILLLKIQLIQIQKLLKVRTRYERIAIQYKTVLSKTILISACLALYFYWRHNEYCEPFVYSFFALSEYSIVLCNMFYHWLAGYDFYHCLVRVGVRGKVSSISMLVTEERVGTYLWQ